MPAFDWNVADSAPKSRPAPGVLFTAINVTAAAGSGNQVTAFPCDEKSIA